MLLSERTKRNAMQKVKQLTPRTWGSTLFACIAQANAWLRGWYGFFGIASASEMQAMRKIDAHLRRRLRAIQLRHWKRKRTIARNLIKLGVKFSVWRQLYAGRKSWWALSHTHAVDQGLRNAYFAKRGLIFLVDLHRKRASADRRPQVAAVGVMGMTSRSHNRPAAGVITRRPEEPYTTSVRTVLWEPGRATAPATREIASGAPSRMSPPLEDRSVDGCVQ